MSWDQELKLLYKTGDDEFDRCFELASEWHVKAVSFARCRDRRAVDDALENCNKALRMAALFANTTHVQEIDSDMFWELFAAADYPGFGTDPDSRRDPSRVPRKPLPSSGCSSVALPLPKREEETP